MNTKEINENQAFIYVLQSTSNTYYKIGESLNPLKRLEEINYSLEEVGNTDYFKIVYKRSFKSKNTAKFFESVVHSNFDNFRLKHSVKFGGYTECFSTKLCLECIVSYIEDLPSDIPLEFQGEVEKDYTVNISEIDLQKLKKIKASDGDIVIHPKILEVCKINNKIFSFAEKTVYSYMLYNMNSLNSVLSISYRKLCSDLGIGSRNSLQKYIKKLQDLGLIKALKTQGTTSTYLVSTCILNVSYVKAR